MRKLNRGLIALMATVGAGVVGLAAIGSAQAAQTVTVAPTAASSTNEFPFGRSDIWPNLVWVYKNVPAFDVKAGDTISFDLQAMNNVDIQVAIAMAPATTNGGDVPAAGLTQIVPSSEVPANPRGDTVTGDYELTFTSQAAFHFPGGGLIIQIAQPGGAFATDTVQQDEVFFDNLAASGDPSGFFVERIVGAAASYPWSGTVVPDYIAGFRLNIGDVPATPPAPLATPAPKKKCKKHKKRSASAAKKCKKKRR
jgi:hypothetical protein